MKRALAALLTMLALAACASPLAKAETPQQALDAAAQRAGQVKSAKFDVAGNVKMTFPAALGAQPGQGGAAAGSRPRGWRGNRNAELPDLWHALIDASMIWAALPTPG